MKVCKSTVVNAPADQVRAYIRDFDKLPESAITIQIG
jgi:uncharacterized membrane protein